MSAPDLKIARKRRPARVVGAAKVRVVTRQFGEHDPLREVAMSMAADACARLDSCWQAVLEDNTPDRMHQFRVAVRRMRVFLHVVRKMETAGRISDLRHALGALTRGAGRQRDLDVVVDDLVKPLIGGDAAGDIARLADALVAERDKTQATTGVMLDSEGARAVRRQLAAFPEHLGEWVAAARPRRSVGKFAQRDLAHRWRKLARQAKVFDKLDAAGVHEMRKSLKKLRYAFDLFSPLTEKRARRAFEGQLRRLQTMFGYLNDVASAKALLAPMAADLAGRDLGTAVGYVLGTHLERARNVHQKIPKAWAKLAATDVARAFVD